MFSFFGTAYPRNTYYYRILRNVASERKCLIAQGRAPGKHTAYKKKTNNVLSIFFFATTC